MIPVPTHRHHEVFNAAEARARVRLHAVDLEWVHARSADHLAVEHDAGGPTVLTRCGHTLPRLTTTASLSRRRICANCARTWLRERAV